MERLGGKVEIPSGKRPCVEVVSSQKGGRPHKRHEPHSSRAQKSTPSWRDQACSMPETTTRRSMGRKEVTIPLGSPFSVDVLAETVPHVKIPAHIKYNGTGDPDDHLSTYEWYMHLHQHADATVCKYFPTTLTDLAQSWFKSLLPGSVHSFGQLSSLFRNHFVSNRRRERTTVELLSLKQEHNESIRDFVGRFNREAVTVPNMNSDIAVLALQSGLKPGAFRDALAQKNVNNLAAALALADEYIRVEEFNKMMKNLGPGGSEREKKDKRGKGSKSEGEKTPRFEDYTPLNKSIEAIYALHRSDKAVRWDKPPKREVLGKDRNKHCDFHGCPGHSTEECRHLRDNIERLIREGFFKQYRDWEKARREKREKPSDDSKKKTEGVREPESSGEILIIFGGDESVEQRKS